MTTYKEYINPEVEFKVRQRGKKNKKQSIKGGPVTEDMIKYRKRESNKPDVKYIYDTSGKTNKTIPLTKTKSPKRLGSSRLAGGGKATHGYGKAYLKGGRVK